MITFWVLSGLGVKRVTVRRAQPRLIAWYR